MSLPPIVPATLQNRIDNGLLIKGGQRGSLTRCASKFGALRRKIEQRQRGDAEAADANAVESAASDLIKDIKFHQLEHTKLLLLEKTLQDQIRSNEAHEEQAAAEMKRVVDEVAEFETKAKRCLAKRRCLQKYEQLATMTNRAFSQPRRKLQQQLVEAEAEAARLHEQHEKLDKLTETRRAQFQLLLQCIADLKATIEEDTQEGGGDDGVAAAGGKRQVSGGASSPSKRSKKSDGDKKSPSGQMNTTTDDDEDEEEGAISEDGETANSAMQVDAELDPLYDDLC